MADNVSKILSWGEKEFSEAEQLLVEIKERHQETLQQSHVEKDILQDIQRLEKDLDSILLKIRSGYEYHRTKDGSSKEYSPEDHNASLFFECSSIIQSIESDLARLRERITNLQDVESLSMKTIDRFNKHVVYIEKMLPHLKGFLGQ